MRISNIHDHLNELNSCLSGRPVSPAFPERLRVLWSVLDNKAVRLERSVGAPYYVTDMGVRLFSDPSVFYGAHLNHANIEPIPRSAFEEFVYRSDLADLKHKIDAVILFFGDYEAVCCVLSKSSAEILRSDDYELLIYCGVVYGACGYGEAITYFDAAERVAHTPT